MDFHPTKSPARILRRPLLTLAAAGALWGGRRVAAQSPEPAKGPLVWLDLDQRQLDDAYDQSKYAPNQAIVLGRYATNSAAVRQRLGAPLRMSYGSLPIEGLDLYPTKAPHAPIQIFLHGGAWRGGLAKDYAFPAEMLTHAGAHFIAVDFNNVVETKGDLLVMARQCRDAIAWVYKNAARFGGDPNRIYLSGHSSGSHLAGVALTTDWRGQYGIPANIIKGAVLASGLYDLKPVRLSARSKYVTFTDAVEEAMSSQRHLEMINAPLVVAHGTLETPEFQRQTDDFAAALLKAGKPVKRLVVDGYNHFELIETYANPYGWIGREVLAQMRL